ncbi:golgi uridine diphosphate-N-acetylglucosamine transporter [Lithohypha guttulata]|uniref:Golgi uridine diphosphate-N- acetylglucosamine transporter n=1 Tax=Lithohypha guttulata TaxID=1690604 RepID=A0AAN7T321_9EURO|nr:golgi uridine diphosphate-N- acetylglucosamine transporter [Lithohypha guttulata]KAK5088445.1 golgi uridine diphosphate-N- acetylglucosamine transporter [Lithohypha guttulata]
MKAVRPTSNTKANPQKSRWDPRPHEHDPLVKTHDFAYLTGIPDPTFFSRSVEALKTIVALLIAQPLLLQTLGLIFGGCCSNVYTLESILNLSSDSGTLITFLQFLFITLYSLPSQLTFHVTSPSDPPPLRPTQAVWFPRLKSRKVPLTKWLTFAGQFVLINVLNNAAFGYKISLPLHIILRSAGPVASMVVGRVWAGKRYSWQKVLAVMLLFVGVVLAALSDAGSETKTSVSATTTGGNSTSLRVTSTTQNAPKPSQPRNTTTGSLGTNTTHTESSPAGPLMEQAPGFALLTLALLLSAVMGVWSDGVYSKYGRNTAIANEQVFYGHLLSLPFFALRFDTLYAQWNKLMAASAVLFPRSGVRKDLTGLTPMAKFLHMAAAARQTPPTWQEKVLGWIKLEHAPKALTYLVLNCITQIACISGVHRLSTQTSALTVSIVLNVRKVVSLLLSIYLFGNELALGVLVGAVIVFLGGGLYGLPERRREVKKEEKKVKGVDGESKKSR